MTRPPVRTAQTIDVARKIDTTANAAPERFLDGYLPYLLGNASFAINKDFDRYVQAYGVTPLEWRVLATLVDEDGMTVGDLARKVVALQPTLTKAIRKMEDSGLVERRSDSEDLRRTLAFITRQGRTLCRKLIDRALQHEEQWLRGFSSMEVKVLQRVLRLIVQRGLAPHPFLD